MEEKLYFYMIIEEILLNENGVVSKFIFHKGSVVTDLDKEDNLKESILRGLDIVSKVDNPYYYLTIWLIK